jgi:acetyl esterase/lipase
VKPFIRVSEIFIIPNTDSALPFDHIKVLVNSNSPLPFTIPEDMRRGQSPDSLPNPGASVAAAQQEKSSEIPISSSSRSEPDGGSGKLMAAFGGDNSPSSSPSESSPLYADDLSLVPNMDQLDGFLLLPEIAANRISSALPLPHAPAMHETDPLVIDVSTHLITDVSSSPLSVFHHQDDSTFKKVPILLHFHGGGFISGSPSTHETYLREWAKETGAIIFSVDYTKSPEKTFPHAVEECYFFYKWLLQEENVFKIRPSQFVVAGDSAGGNLALAVLFKAMQANLRMPDALFLFYPAVDVSKYALMLFSPIFPHPNFSPLRQDANAESNSIRARCPVTLLLFDRRFGCLYRWGALHTASRILFVAAPRA